MKVTSVPVSLCARLSESALWPALSVPLSLTLYKYSSPNKHLLHLHTNRPKPECFGSRRRIRSCSTTPTRPTNANSPLTRSRGNRLRDFVLMNSIPLLDGQPKLIAGAMVRRLPRPGEEVPRPQGTCGEGKRRVWPRHCHRGADLGIHIQFDHLGCRRRQLSESGKRICGRPVHRREGPFPTAL